MTFGEEICYLPFGGLSFPSDSFFLIALLPLVLLGLSMVASKATRESSTLQVAVLFIAMSLAELVLVPFIGKAWSYWFGYYTGTCGIIYRQAKIIQDYQEGRMKATTKYPALVTSFFGRIALSVGQGIVLVVWMAVLAYPNGTVVLTGAVTIFFLMVMLAFNEHFRMWK